MHSRRHVALLFISIISATAAFAAEEGPSRDELLAEFTQLIPPDAISASHTLALHGFTLAFDRYRQLGRELAPDGKEFQSVFVSAPGTFKTQVVEGVEPNVDNGVSIFHRDSGAPLLVLSDSDGNGQPDMLSYSSVDADGKVTMTANDYDMDGQPDLRINFSQHYFEIWHADRWHRVESRDGKRGIMLSGKFVELRMENNRYSVP